MIEILKFLASLFTGTAGATIGGAVSDAAQVASLAAILVPFFLWLGNHKDAVFIAVTYGELAFWSAIIFGQVFVAVKLAHNAPPP